MQLLDTSPDHIEALVRHPDVEDTNDIDRHAYSVPADASYGTRWMWVRDRLPVLRTPGVAEGIILVCAVVLIASAALVIRDRCHRVRVRRDRTS